MNSVAKTRKTTKAALDAQALEAQIDTLQADLGATNDLVADLAGINEQLYERLDTLTKINHDLRAELDRVTRELQLAQARAGAQVGAMEMQIRTQGIRSRRSGGRTNGGRTNRSHNRDQRNGNSRW